MHKFDRVVLLQKMCVLKKVSRKLWRPVTITPENGTIKLYFNLKYEVVSGEKKRDIPIGSF